MQEQTFGVAPLVTHDELPQFPRHLEAPNLMERQHGFEGFFAILTEVTKRP
ncbi:MAG: hypothetical protein M3N31_09540 [Actinomycetota bacterium]|nr:hypothetical protein [Actinomycetota bacterium]